jgi:hypothetical protein
VFTGAQYFLDGRRAARLRRAPGSDAASGPVSGSVPGA